MAVGAQWDGAAIAAQVEGAAEAGVYMACEVLLSHALDRTPFSEGDLRQSGMASAEGLRGAVSFNTPYALKQHEELSYAHPNGGEAKYLEKAVNAFAGEFLDVVKVGMQGLL
ncbi:minor capsid protein [Rhodococcus opacus]|uniref:minor capsid protein n=1 Tax=Rhodococcus opacus TaxID=37919 RepID=UPI001C47C871|nr:minor capsid protein [Rhodococcus opacus]MBV6758357.1 minor capsid protein [Rhodococcus opacus]